MMKLFLLIKLIFFASVHLNAQLLDENVVLASKATARLSCTKVTDFHGIGLGLISNTEYGSGFFIIDTNYFSLYLVTAEHVARKMNDLTKIEIIGSDKKTVTLNLLDITENKDSIDWVYHPKADVACVSIDYNIMSNPKLAFVPFPIGWVEKRRIPISQRDVNVIGFTPETKLADSFRTEVRLSRLLTDFDNMKRADNNKTFHSFILKDQSVGGLSGGPVFELPTILDKGNYLQFINVFRIVGIIHGNWIEEKEYAIVTPSQYICELLSSTPRFSGTLKTFHSNGKVWNQVKYKQGLAFKVINNYDSIGRKMNPGNLDKGEGVVFLYDEGGNLYSKFIYSKGKILQRVKIVNSKKNKK